MFASPATGQRLSPIKRSMPPVASNTEGDAVLSPHQSLTQLRAFARRTKEHRGVGAEESSFTADRSASRNRDWNKGRFTCETHRQTDAEGQHMLTSSAGCRSCASHPTYGLAERRKVWQTLSAPPPNRIPRGLHLIASIRWRKVPPRSWIANGSDARPFTFSSNIGCFKRVRNRVGLNGLR